MKICWFNDSRLGVVERDQVLDVSAALNVLPAPRYPAPTKGDPLIANLDRVREEIRRLAPGAKRIPVKDARFHCPVAAPTKIIGVPVNYMKHVEEAEMQKDAFPGRYQGTIEEQGLFLKSNSSLIGPSEPVKLRFLERRTDHEMELGVVIGKYADNIAEADALDYVAGYCLALDMVIRGTEDRSFRKSIDTYSVAGPWLVTADEIPDPSNLNFSLTVNGEVRQASNTKFMIMGIKRQIAWASQWYALHPGDIIMTGTCEGVSRVVPGDVMHCEIETVGSMDVKVTAA
ncbi:MAG TPA: fumarylacetoacetate hydrolase family protein [Xanthobacteraceae bacterium]|nr:fumarylacetoacetate hydrolase family protein [Xanthobacteraceae bacterium]